MRDSASELERAGTSGNDNGPDAAGADDEDQPIAAVGDRVSFKSRDSDDEGDETGLIEINGHAEAGEDDDGPDHGENSDRTEGDSAGRGEGEARRRGRRRGRRGGRRNRERGEIAAAPGLEPQPFLGDDDAAPEPLAAPPPHEDAARPERRDGRSRGSRHDVAERIELPVVAEAVTRNSASHDAPALKPSVPAPVAATPPIEAPAEIPRHRQRAMAEPSEPKIERVVVRSDASTEATQENEPERPARKGWWSRRFGGE